jgi:hypothetical protein
VAASVHGGFATVFRGPVEYVSKLSTNVTARAFADISSTAIATKINLHLYIMLLLIQKHYTIHNLLWLHTKTLVVFNTHP